MQSSNRKLLTNDEFVGKYKKNKNKSNQYYGGRNGPIKEEDNEEDYDASEYTKGMTTTPG